MSLLLEFIDIIISVHDLNRWIGTKGHCKITSPLDKERTKHIILSRCSGRPVAVFDVEFDVCNVPVRAEGFINGESFTYPPLPLVPPLQLVDISRRKFGDTRIFIER